MDPSSFFAEITQISNATELFNAFEKLDEYPPEEQDKYMILLLEAKDKLLGQKPE